MNTLKPKHKIGDIVVVSSDKGYRVQATIVSAEMEYGEWAYWVEYFKNDTKLYKNEKDIILNLSQ